MGSHLLDEVENDLRARAARGLPPADSKRPGCARIQTSIVAAGSPAANQKSGPNAPFRAATFEVQGRTVMARILPRLLPLRSTVRRGGSSVARSPAYRPRRERRHPLDGAEGADDQGARHALQATGLSWDEFRRYWREVHGSLAVRLPGPRRNVENHSPEPGNPPYGVAELDFDRADDFLAAIGSPT
jgi:hypothetical protein